MTDTPRKTSRLDQDLARQAPEQIDYYIRKLAELAEIGVKRVEEVVARMRANADARRAGKTVAAEPALTFEQAAEEYERVTRAVRICMVLSHKLRNEQLSREQEAAAGTVVVRPLDPRLERQVKLAITQLAEPYKRTTRH